jgi:DNA invertase Pin-like site-specific DNA recombinase
MISERTRVALKAAQRRGVKLGNPEHLTDAARRKGRKASAKVRTNTANERAKDLATVALPLRDRGASLREIAATLTAEEIPTPRGGAWSADAVRRVLLRLQAVA